MRLRLCLGWYNFRRWRKESVARIYDSRYLLTSQVCEIKKTHHVVRLLEIVSRSG